MFILSSVKKMVNKLPITELFFLHSLQKKAKKNDGAFAGEYEALDRLTFQLKIDDGYVIDIAASDGYSQSCTLGFFRRKNWSGLAVEMDPIKFSRLSFLYSKFPNAKLARNRVTPKNIRSLLECYEVPKDISLLNLDIDSYDLYVIDQMLQSEYKPQIITMEVNEKIPPGIFFTVDYSDEHYWQGDHFYGCSIDAAASVIKPFGYILHSMLYNNAIFIREDIIPNSFKDLSPKNAYDTGYKNKKNRKELFPWNANTEQWLHSDTNEAIDMIGEHFKKYSGKFTLRKI